MWCSTSMTVAVNEQQRKATEEFRYILFVRTKYESVRLYSGFVFVHNSV